MSEAMCAGCGRWPVFYETTQSCSTCQPGRASEMIDGLRARAEAAERERDRLRGVLEEAEGRLRDYAWEIGGHSGDSESGEHFDDCELCAVEVTIAKVEAALAGEGEAKECWCQWEVGDSPCPTHGMDEMKGGRNA